MRIILVDNDPHIARFVSKSLQDAFLDTKIDQFGSEVEFKHALKSFVESPPSLFVLDTMMMWCHPKDAEKYPHPDDGFHKAGKRCIDAVRGHPELSKIPIIIFSVCSESQVIDSLGSLPDNVFILSKDGSLTKLVRLIQSFSIAASSFDLAILQKDVFVVHGHDNESKETLARFIERLGGRPIILNEQPNLGRTIIEKFEHYSHVSFAVVLLTPDDIGGTSSKQLKARSRQNVIFELGFFVAKLGRRKVCALYKEDVEIPSDIQGVIYTTMGRRMANGSST